jgi:hypothetical protein
VKKTKNFCSKSKIRQIIMISVETPIFTSFFTESPKIKNCAPEVKMQIPKLDCNCPEDPHSFKDIIAIRTLVHFGKN